VNRVPKKLTASSRRPKNALTSAGEEQIHRVRRLCLALPGTTEKISHGEPTWFAGKVYVMFANNHHNDGHIAVYLPVPPGFQASLIKDEPRKYFMPPYVGVRGWVGIELGEVSDDELGYHICEAWRLIAPAKKRTSAQNSRL
jgi:hypothetical protein